jgi:hypothetical protein
VSKLKELHEKFMLSLNVNPSILTNLNQELNAIIVPIHMHSMNSDEGYCYKFKLPETQVLNLCKTLQLTKEEIYEAFKNEWGADRMKNKIYNNPYYQILLFIVYYAIHAKNEKLANNAWLIAMFRLWNGRRMYFLPYCNKNIMRYAVSYLTTSRHNVTKYDGPFSLIKDYFTPTLLKKYSPIIKQTPSKTLRLIEQSWQRIFQLFYFNPRQNVLTDKSEATGGLLYIYKTAKDQNLSLSTISVTTSKFDDDTSTVDDYTSTHNRNEIIDSIVNFITTTPNFNYSNEFLMQINRDTRVSIKIVEKLLKQLHNYSYHDQLVELYSIILSKLNVNDKQDICSTNYLANFKKLIISSKNNADSKQLQTLILKLLDQVFKNKLQISFSKFSITQQIQIRNVLLYGLSYCLRRHICYNR